MRTPENALLSVYNKEGIVDFAAGLHEMDVNLFASGGTANAIDKAGIPVRDVAELVGGDAILRHRVVTLSREIHGGLLADPTVDIDVNDMEREGIPWLDVVCTDMYPLREAIAAGESETTVTETTDVGGPTMLHSAAKGRRIVLSRADQRPVVLEWLQEGRPDEENVRRTLAAVAEREAADYLTASAEYLVNLSMSQPPTSSYAAMLQQPLAT
jgi:phosphoribosylaminoimidazolecarboxamide formyltransferase/IMP cyclohydrolase